MWYTMNKIKQSLILFMNTFCEAKCMNVYLTREKVRQNQAELDFIHEYLAREKVRQNQSTIKISYTILHKPFNRVL